MRLRFSDCVNILGIIWEVCTLTRLLSASGSWGDCIIFYRTLILVAVLALKSIIYQVDWLHILLIFFRLSVALIHTESKN